MSITKNMGIIITSNYINYTISCLLVLLVTSYFLS